MGKPKYELSDVSVIRTLGGIRLLGRLKSEHPLFPIDHRIMTSLVVGFQAPDTFETLNSFYRVGE